MHRIKIEKGTVFGRLSVIREAEQAAGNHRRFECLCECGKRTVVFLSALRSGLTTSCGCWRKERATIHGRHRTAEYIAWVSMIARCVDTKAKGWKNYGGRGISVCQRWRDSFNAFLLDMGMRPTPQHSLDRYPNNDGNYEPGNVRWATATEQLRNQRRNALVPYMGRLVPATEAAQAAGIKPSLVLSRLRRGWADGLLDPPSKKKRHRWK